MIAVKSLSDVDGTSGRVLSGVLAFIFLFFVQVVSCKLGSFISGMISCQKIDPYNIFARQSIHHVILMIVGLIIILVLSKKLQADFYFSLGDTGCGIKCLAVFSAAFVVISLAVHMLMLFFGQLPQYKFPIVKRNVLGTLGFQLLLSGPAEEIVFRALPVTVLTHAFGKRIAIKGHISLEVLLAALLFSFAHIKWSLYPFVFELNFFNLIYAFVMGTIQGVVLQRSKSIIYPMLMHSFSNVSMVGIGYLFSI